MNTTVQKTDDVSGAVSPRTNIKPHLLSQIVSTLPPYQATNAERQARMPAVAGITEIPWQTHTITFTKTQAAMHTYFL